MQKIKKSVFDHSATCIYRMSSRSKPNKPIKNFTQEESILVCYLWQHIKLQKYYIFQKLYVYKS